MPEELAISMVCATCGSADVLADAYAEWDVGNQCWSVQSVMDKGHHCNACDGECRIEELTLTEEGTAAIEAAAETTTIE